MAILILGIGSPLGDDRLGWLVAGKLREEIEINPLLKSQEILIEIADRPGLNLLNWLQADYQKVLLIDMMKTNQNQPGNIYRLAANEIIGFSGMLSSHSLGVSPSLALASALEIPIDHVEFWGIEGSKVTPDIETLTPGIAPAIDQVCNEIVNVLITTT